MYRRCNPNSNNSPCFCRPVLLSQTPFIEVLKFVWYEFLCYRNPLTLHENGLRWFLRDGEGSYSSIHRIDMRYIISKHIYVYRL